MKHMYALLLLLLTLPALPLPARADAPEIVAARAEGQTIHVTLAHPDTGWDHYADGWEVVTGDGRSLGLRVLAHPHVNEQPFTRSLRLDAPLPDGPVSVRARCNVDGWGEALVPVDR
ncbi:MAG TPA: hypothetical protein DIU07_07030 [Rhodobacteraceae bacterium]|nr:hypothetical protein [Paracoccaceae bacterium]